MTSARRARWRVAISALVGFLGYGQPQAAAAAIAAASRSAGEKSRDRAAIRLGLKELAKRPPRKGCIAPGRTCPTRKDHSEARV